MQFMKELRGKEVIDREGNTIGLVEDLDISESGRVTRIIALPKGIVNKITRKRLNIGIEDVETVSHLIMLNKTEEELKGIFKCKACEQTFESENSRKLHFIKKHKKPAKKTPIKKRIVKKKRKK
ncbi:PRC-barrel domain-containing protein [archaeon]|nr:PRC-barrel domain-containing protein [archaeon]